MGAFSRQLAAQLREATQRKSIARSQRKALRAMRNKFTGMTPLRVPR